MPELVRLRALQGEVGDFGGAVEAEGEADGAEAAVDVELHVVELETSFDVLLAHGGEDERADGGEADLASVGVAGEHGIDVGEARVADDVVDVIRLMAHEDDGRGGGGGDGEVEIGVAGAGVVGAAEPEVVGAALDRDVAVDEHGRAVGAEGIDDVLGTDGDVVVAETGEALGGLELGEDLGGDAGGAPGDAVGGRAAADDVAGDEDEVGVEVVDGLDGLAEEPGLGVLLEMDVGELDEAEADEGVGEVAEGEGALGDLELMARVGAGVGGEREPGSGRPDKETAAGNSPQVRMRFCLRNGGHIP